MYLCRNQFNPLFSLLKHLHMKNVQPTRFVQEKDFFQTSSGFINILVSVIELYFSENPNAYVIHGECDPIKFTSSNIALCKISIV